MSTKAYAAKSAATPLEPWNLERREPKPHDVELDILYCGICHSDLHTARNEWGNTIYPVVPGHEIVGRVTRIGGHVKKYKAGDLAAIVAWWTVAENAIIVKRDLNSIARMEWSELTTL